MPTQVQFRRGTTSQNNSFTGAAGEISVDTDKDTIRIHDNSTAGGFELLRVDLTNITGDTDDITEGSSNLYYTNARVDSEIDSYLSGGTGITVSSGAISIDFTEFSTTNITEGTNLYYTDARVDAEIDNYLSAGTGITLAGSGSIAVDTSVIATISYVDTAVSNLVDTAPGALDTLNELAAALGDDANFSTTVTNSLALKAPLANPALTGTPTAPTAATTTNTTQIATTAFVQQEIQALKDTLYAFGS